jgi:hypothetical protein
MHSTGALAQKPITPGEMEVWQPIVDLHFADDSGVVRWWIPEAVLLGNTDRGFGLGPVDWTRSPKGWKYHKVDTGRGVLVAVNVERIERGWLASLTVGNQSDEALPNVVCPVCLLLRASGTFEDADWKRTYYRSDDKFLTYHGRATDGGKPIFRMSLVKGQKQIEVTTRHQNKWGFTKKPSDDGIIGVVSEDKSTVLTTTWKPTHHLQANLMRTFSCIHANPYFGTLAPGQSMTRQGCVLLTPGGLGEAWTATRKVMGEV